MIKWVNMQKITPHLWFEKDAGKAAEFYASVFPGTVITDTTILHDTPSGTVDLVTMEILGQEFLLIGAGPYFKFTPAISFRVNCTTKDEVDILWNKLIPAGSALMELGSYPFSERYGWLMDKYGLSWQIMYQTNGEVKQRITPTLMYVGDHCGQTEAAVNFYTSVFHNSSVNGTMRYGEGEAPDKPGTIRHMAFTLEGQEFAAMDSAHKHEFTFTEAISLLIHCDTQEEIDYFWEKLSADPAAEQCGWLKDKYGVSWQVHPVPLTQMMKDKDEKRLARVTQAFLQMKKFNIAELQKAYEGK